MRPSCAPFGSRSTRGRRTTGIPRRLSNAPTAPMHPASGEDVSAEHVESYGTMPARDSVLLLPGAGGVEAARIRDLVGAVHDAHSGLIAYDRIVSRGRYREYLVAPWFFEPETTWLQSGWRGLADSIVLEDERLVVASVELSSPGVWTFLGALNPLETLRKYLDDRHGRRQDREYREAEEKRQLKLENDAREIAVLRQRLELAREYGVPDEQAVALLQQLVGLPLGRLGELQDQGVIDGSQARIEQLRPGDTPS
jgi:hypothetical protein